MKFRVTMKDPDTLHDAIREAVAEEITKLDLEPDEMASIGETRCDKVIDICSKWFKYSESTTAEIDTTAATCVVVPTGES